jgi:mannose/cellobiose epimerase-like protein (N-acyl-D-glucosamine 2-epimerase family)
MIAALVDADAQRPRAGYDVALLQTVEFVTRYLVDPTDGVWFDTVAPDGSMAFRPKAHDWKSTYHDVRALLKFASAYSEPLS